MEHPRNNDAFTRSSGLLRATGLLKSPPEGWQALGRMANLRLLYLQGNPFTFSDVAWDAIGQLSNLEAAPIDPQQSVDSARFWETLSKLKKLGFLQLHRAQVTGMSTARWEVLAGFIQPLRSSRCGRRGSPSPTPVGRLWVNSSISSTFGSGMVSGESLRGGRRGLSRLRKLKGLDLAWNKMKLPGAEPAQPRG